MNLATTTYDARDVALTALAENLRAASSIVHRTITLRDLRELRQRVDDLRSTTREIRRFTERVESQWDTFSAGEKRQLYAMALSATRRSDGPNAATPGLPFSGKLMLRLMGPRLRRVVHDAEDALFWFADEIFDHVEGEAPEVQNALSARLEAARTEADSDEHDRVVG